MLYISYNKIINMPRIFKRTTDEQLHLILIQAISEQDEYKAHGLIDPHNPLSISLTYLHKKYGSILNHALTTKFYCFIPALWEYLKSKGEEIIKINLSSRNHLNQSCYQLIIESCNSQLLAEFLQHANKEDIFLQDAEGNTPLHVAAQLQSLEMTEILLSYTTNRITELNKPNIFGSTPLLIASITDNPIDSYLSYLIEQGADMRVHDKYGKNTFHYLTKNAYQAILFKALQTIDIGKQNKYMTHRTHYLPSYTPTENNLVDTFLHHYRQHILQSPNEALISDYLALVERHNIAAYILSLIEFRPTHQMKLIRDKILTTSPKSTTSINLMALSSLTDKEAHIRVQTSLFGELEINARILMIMSNIHTNLMTLNPANRPCINWEVIDKLNRTDAENFKAIQRMPAHLIKDDGNIIDLGRALYQINSPYHPTLAQQVSYDLARLDELIFGIDTYSLRIQRQANMINALERNKNIITLSIMLAVFILFTYMTHQAIVPRKKEGDLKSISLALVVGATISGSISLLAHESNYSCLFNITATRRKLRKFIGETLQKEVILPLQKLTQLETHNSRYNLLGRCLPTTDSNLGCLNHHLSQLTTTDVNGEELLILLRELNNDLKTLYQEIEKSGLPFSSTLEQQQTYNLPLRASTQ